MTALSNNIEEQMEAAFHYRGYVTLHLKSGEALEAYIYNRQWAAPKNGDAYIDVFLKGDMSRQRYLVSDVQCVILSGEDCASGKSYEEWLAKNKPPAPVP